MYVIVRVEDSLFRANEECRKYTPDIRQAKTFLSYNSADMQCDTCIEEVKGIGAYLQTPDDIPF